MQKLIIKLCFLFTPVAGLMLAVNISLDYELTHVPSILTKLIGQGERVGVPREYIDFDERVFQKGIIESNKVEVSDTVVFGSSRSRYIKTELFPGVSLRNHSINAASLEDFISLFWLLLKNDKQPKHIILSLDYWILMPSEVSGYTNYQVYADDYQEAKLYFKFETSILGAHANKVYKLRRYLEVFSISYFQNNFKKLIKKFLKTLLSEAKDSENLKGLHPLTVNNFRTEETMSYEVYVINSDGSFADEKIPNSVSKVRKIVRTYDPGNPDLKDIDENARLTFEAFLDVLLDKNIEITLLLLPIHPYTYKEWTVDDYKGLIKAENYFKRVSQMKNLKILGSYNPNNAGAVESDFRDWLHPLRPLVEKIVKH